MASLLYKCTETEVELMVRPRLQIVVEWCKEFGGNEVVIGLEYRFTCSQSDECVRLAVLIHNLFANRSSSPSFELERNFSSEAVNEILAVDPIDDHVDPSPDGSAWNYVVHATWGEIPVIDTIEALFQEFTRIGIGDMNSLIWRGHSRIGYQLHSTLFRKYPRELGALLKTGKTENVDTEDIMRRIESEWLSDARLRGFGSQNGSEFSDLELFALAQHLGGATRLLDFTRNVMVALWFVCNNRSDRASHGLLLGIHERADGIQRLTQHIAVRKPLHEIIDEFPSSLVVWQPPYINPRMHIQQSVLGFSKIVSDGYFGSVQIPFPFMGIPQSAGDDTFRFAISPSFKSREYHRLKHLLGYQGSSMFPDFTGFAQNWHYQIDANGWT